jgi:hypothetical protein
MAKIKLSDPDSPYSASIDTKVMEIKIEEAFLGVGFVTPAGEKLAVSMRDSGFEIRYCANGVDSGWLSLNDGVIEHRDQP